MSLPQKSFFYSSFSQDPFSSAFPDTCQILLSLQLSCLTFLLTAITPGTCQGYTYSLPVNMWKCLSLSKFWGLLSTTYQTSSLCLQENINGKSAELKTVACEWLKFKSCFSKKYPFSTSFSPWGRKNPDFAICFAIKGRSTGYTYTQYFTIHNSEFLQRRIGSEKVWTEHLAYLSRMRTLCWQKFVLLASTKGRVSATLCKWAASVCFLLVWHLLGRESRKKLQDEKKKA